VALNSAHRRIVHSRRVQRLAAGLLDLLPSATASLLDVGSGDGTLAALVGSHRPGLRIEGTDVLVRPDTAIPTTEFDGLHLPHADRSMDIVTLIDVVHHSNDQPRLLAECARVARIGVIIKDHLCEDALDRRTLALMDYVGNAAYGVNLPYAYWPRREWDRRLAEAGLRVRTWRQRLGIYPWFVWPLFERNLHFMAFCETGG
jgi:ubiquinone/menaquinone biosynthesis C-methylase UbiE